MLLRMDNKHLEQFGLQYQIGSGAFQFEYDAGDRYGTGDKVGLNMTLRFFGANNAAIAHVEYGSPSSIIPAWNTNSTSSTSNDTISQGRLRIGREQSHQGGNSLSTIRCSLPKLTKGTLSSLLNVVVLILLTLDLSHRTLVVS